MRKNNHENGKKKESRQNTCRLGEKIISLQPKMRYVYDLYKGNIGY